jgi:hypothetical protein
LIHLYPEFRSENIARIPHHKNGVTDCDCYPQCLPCKLLNIYF